MKKYKNFFHNPKDKNSQKDFPADPNAVEYKDYTIHKRHATEFHVVSAGMCIAMRGSVQSCKNFIDEARGERKFLYIEEPGHFTERDFNNLGGTGHGDESYSDADPGL